MYVFVDLAVSDLNISTTIVQFCADLPPEDFLLAICVY